MIRLVAAAALLLTAAALPAAAAEPIAPDVRCILLSGMFAKTAPDDKGKLIARATGAFYLGRIDGRTDAAALTAALRAESKTIDPKTAAALMDACAGKLARAQTTMNAIGKTVGTEK